jgi:hypothetical protein
MQFIADGSYRMPATASEPETKLQVVGGNRFCSRKMPDNMNDLLRQHENDLAFFHPGYKPQIWFPERIVNTLCFTDSRVLVRFKLKGGEPDVLVHIQLCTDYTRSMCTQDSFVLPSDYGDEVVSWTASGSEEDTGTWKVMHLMSYTKKLVEVRWLGGTIDWISRSDLSPALRDDVVYLVRRYKEERARGIPSHYCTMV